jgi:hypothetical protein
MDGRVMDPDRGRNCDPGDNRHPAERGARSCHEVLDPGEAIG